MRIEAHCENWVLRDTFAISRGSKDSVDVVVVEIEDDSFVGVGEALPYVRYQQSTGQTLKQISQIAHASVQNLTRESLRRNFPPNAARNALDCALWDLEAKKSGKPVWQLAKLPPPGMIPGVCSLSMEKPQKLADSAKMRSEFPVLKIKLGNELVIESVEAVRNVRPDATLIIDANEAWDFDTFRSYLPELEKLGVEMIEQPLSASEDVELELLESKIPICADESFHLSSDLERLHNRYDIFNIKLDKSGGLTEAIEASRQIIAAGKEIMVGSMLATSLSLAPAVLLAHNARYVDLDSSIWLSNDRPGGVQFTNGIISPAERTLWG